MEDKSRKASIRIFVWALALNLTMVLIIGFIVGRNTATWTGPDFLRNAWMAIVNEHYYFFGGGALILIVVGLATLRMVTKPTPDPEAEVEYAPYIDGEWRLIDVQRE